MRNGEHLEIPGDLMNGISVQHLPEDYLNIPISSLITIDIQK
jgi:hypothetical protein